MNMSISSSLIASAGRAWPTHHSWRFAVWKADRGGTLSFKAAPFQKKSA
jgi:hypothetical protein